MTCAAADATDVQLGVTCSATYSYGSVHYDLINGITGGYKIVSRNYSYGQETAASGGLSQTKVCPSSHKYGVYSIAYEPSCTTSDEACLAITTTRPCAWSRAVPMARRKTKPPVKRQVSFTTAARQKTYFIIRSL